MNKEKLFYLGFGGNIGDPELNITQAIDLLEKSIDIKLVAKSSFWRTEPQGDKNQPWYVNAVVCFSYENLSPHLLLEKIAEVEYNLGRERVVGNQNAARTIDIDILDFSGIILDENNLTLPHPRMFSRAFVLVPLHEIASDFEYNGKNISAYLDEIEYTLDGKKIYQQ